MFVNDPPKDPADYTTIQRGKKGVVIWKQTPKKLITPGEPGSGPECLDATEWTLKALIVKRASWFGHSVDGAIIVGVAAHRRRVTK